MKIVDCDQVDVILAPLKAKFEDCAHGEGNQCETLNETLDCCATICFTVADEVRRWAQGIFAGEVVFDPEAENHWRSEVHKILSEATRIWHAGRSAEIDCFELPAQSHLAAALWELSWLLDKWVSPRLSIGPSARTKLNLSATQRLGIQAQLAGLSPRFDAGSK